MFRKLIYLCHDHGYVIGVPLFLVVGVDVGPCAELASPDRAWSEKEGKLLAPLGTHDQFLVRDGLDGPVNIKDLFLNRLALSPKAPRLEQEGNA